MSLRSKLLLILWVSFALLLVALVYLQFSSNRDYLRVQQQTSIVGSMNALSIELAPHLEENNTVAIETILNAFFDGGLYQRVTLELFNDEQMFVRENKKLVNDVPQWFQALNLYPPVMQNQLISAGWIQLGEVTVTGHTGFAVRQLWQQMIKQILLCLAAFTLCGLVLSLALNKILVSLGLVRRQVEAVKQQQSTTQLEVPPQKELQPVFQAVNELSQWSLLNKQEGDKLRQQAFQDTVSGLGNRAWFASKLQTWSDKDSNGAVVLTRVGALETIYQSEGFKARDQLVSDIAQSLRSMLKDWPGALAARIGKHEFALLLPDIGHDSLDSTVKRISQQIARLQGLSPEKVNIGAAERMPGQSLGALLSTADSALRKSVSEESGYCILHSVEPGVDFSRSDWRDMIHEAINGEELTLLAQRVQDLDDHTLHQEVFVTIEHQGVRYRAGQFIPAVEQFDLGKELDQRVLQLVERVLKGKDQPQVRLVVNLTCSSLRDSEFHTWIGQFMQRNQDFSQQLIFEIPEFALVNYRQQVRDFSKMCHEKGFALGIDQVGQHLDITSELELIQPSYIKLDPAITRMVSEHEGHNSILKAVVAAAKNLNIVPIATRVEDEQMLQKLLGVDIQAVQGFIRPPELIPIPVEHS